MEFSIKNVPFKADAWEVTKAIAAQALHVCPGPFVSGPEERLPNFKVVLNDSPAGGVQNDGTGTFTLIKSLGRKFQRLSLDNQISVVVREKRLKFFATGNVVDSALIIVLEKAPFVDPDIAKDRTCRINRLCYPFHLARVQIGAFYRPDNAHPNDPRSFSIEWPRDHGQRNMGMLSFEYEHKSLKVRIGDPVRDVTTYNLIIRFSSINKMAMGYEFGNPYVCFDLSVPPLIQEEESYPQELGKKAKNSRRLGFINAGHEIIAPYAHQIRIELSDASDYGFEDVTKRFEYYCKVSSLRPPKQGVAIEATGKQRFFCSRKLNDIAIWLRSPLLSSNWRVAFQVEALLHNGVANTEELMSLRPRIEDLVCSLGTMAGDVMRCFVENATRRPPGQRVSECFQNALKKKARRPRTTPSRGRLLCHHVTFTPTRLLLEGPTVTQSNRVIREYEGYEDHFLRVNFCEEDHAKYRWDREVDTEHHLHERVGTLLKEGFNLAGRHFDFLAYSQSALKEHSVCIRNSLGDFSGVIKSPSKYGARMAQAFSATDPSVRIRMDQWAVVPDIEENGINFTDGVGTISPGLANLIWMALCEDRPNLATTSVVPFAYQIRFLGCKGVVSVDLRLKGIRMHVRPSMKKFDIPGEEFGTIEIADFFGRANIPYLNRPLVALLEDRSAPKEVFVQLQNIVVTDTRTAHDSAALFVKLLESSQLCFNYRLALIIRRMNALGLELKPNHLQKPLDTPFFARLRTCAINHVLRGVKYEARIQIPNSYMLVGVADEGPAYAKDDSVYRLPQGKIFACVQNPEDEEPRYIQGMCLVFRNPVIHPGDVQRVYAIGRPPDQPNLFGHLKNVVVFSSTGTWSLPNGLGGGDLDGDKYTVIQHGDLLVPEHHDPASYPSVKPFELDRESTIDDVCNFILEYINSDVLGLVASKHLEIADQSKDGSLDPRCLKLAEMHSRAVDYPKNGHNVNIKDMPRSLIAFKPDWKRADEDAPGPSDYYESDRALGLLYRNIKLEDTDILPVGHLGSAEQHPFTRALYPHVRRHLSGLFTQLPAWTSTLYMTYCEELAYIASAFSLSKAPESRLSEEELVIGTILANNPNKGYRKSRMFDMKENIGYLVHDIRQQLVGRLEDISDEHMFKEKLTLAWAVWMFSLEKVRSSSGEFGSESFGLLALGLVLDCLEKLGSLPPLKHPTS